MSDFSKFAMKVDAIAKAAFEDFQRAESALRAAEAKAKEYPQRGGFVDVEYTAKSARAAADLLEARAAMDGAQRRLMEHGEEIRSIRRALVEAVGGEYSADPKQVDAATLTLLQSGILTPDEYSRLLSDAQTRGNFTMARLIGKAADTAADGLEHEDVNAAAELRAVAIESAETPASGYIQAFDFLTDVFDRTCANPCMIDDWSELTAETVESF